MPRNVGGSTEELKRLLRQIEEIDPRQKPALPNVPGLGVQLRAALPSRGKRTGLWRLALVAIFIVVAAGVAAIFALKLPAISIVVVRDGVSDMKSTTVPSAARDPHEAEPRSQLRRSMEPNQIDAEPAAVTPRTAAPNATSPDPARLSRPLLIGALQQTSLQPGQAWPLGLRITSEVTGGTLVVKGLAAGAKLSVGRPSDTNGWELKADKIDGAVIIPPPGFAGSMELSVELQLAEGLVAERRSVHLEWARPPERNSTAIPLATAPARPAELAELNPRKLDPEEVASLRRRGEEFFANRDVASARLMLLCAAEAADARAALALAKTYDPIALGGLGLRGSFADAAMARTWYEKARQFGSTEAQHRLDMLASRSQ